MINTHFDGAKARLEPNIDHITIHLEIPKHIAEAGITFGEIRDWMRFHTGESSTLSAENPLRNYDLYDLNSEVE